MTSLTTERETFIDSARGISIVLVVTWHSFDEDLFFNGPMAFLRMPLFFFMAGLFASSLLSSPALRVVKDKIGQLMWIFVLWTTILYLSRSGLEQIVKNGSLDTYPLYSMFWSPHSTIWFIYALAIAYLVVLITRQMNRVAVIVAAVGMYTWSVTYGDWANPPFYLKVLRLLPAFIIAVWYGRQIIDISKKSSSTWFFFALLYFSMAYGVYYSDLAKIGPVTAVVSACGIFFILTVCYQYRDSPAMHLMAAIGERSIYVFLMHRIILSYVNEGATYFGVEQYWFVRASALILAIAIPATIGMYIVDKFMPWLVSAPWIKRKRNSRIYVPKTEVA